MMPIKISKSKRPRLSKPETDGARLRRQWRKHRVLELERQTQLDLFEDRRSAADTALEELKAFGGPLP
jgi:hypothetical protein